MKLLLMVGVVAMVVCSGCKTDSRGRPGDESYQSSGGSSSYERRTENRALYDLPNPSPSSPQMR